MNKEEILKELFKLPKEDILDIETIITGYRETINKSGKDTTLIRLIYANGYHKLKEFFGKEAKNNIGYNSTLNNKKEDIYFIKSLEFVSKLNIELEDIKSILEELKGVDKECK